MAGSLNFEGKKYGLSLGDRACLSLGKNLNAKIITCDKVWKSLENSLSLEIDVF